MEELDAFKWTNVYARCQHYQITVQGERFPRLAKGWVGLTRLHGPIRVKRSGYVKGVEEDGQERQAVFA